MANLAMWVVEIYGNHSIHYLVSGNFFYSEMTILECRACGVVAFKKVYVTIYCEVFVEFERTASATVK